MIRAARGTMQRPFYLGALWAHDFSDVQSSILGIIDIRYGTKSIALG